MITEICVVIVILLTILQYYTQKKPTNFPPGPIGIPGVGYLPFIRLPVHVGFADLSKKYGNILGVFLGNFPTVVLSDWTLIKEALRDERFAGRPPLHIFEQRSFGKQRGIVFSSGKDWQEQRRFAMKNLRDFGFGKGSMEELIKDEVVDLISEFKKELDHPISLESRFNTAVLNALWHIIAGERYSHDDPRLKKIIKVLSEAFDNTQVQGPLFYMPWLSRIFPKLTGLTTLMDALYSTYDFLQETIDAHKKNFDPNNPRDLIDVYLKEIENTTDPTSSFMKGEGDKQLLVVLLDLFAAGTDTTSTTLNFAILYLITHPESQKKVHEEIDSIVGTSRLPCLLDRPRMPYIEAVIAETMRMSSIAGLGGIHSTTETIEFHGYTLPKNTVVLCNLWLLHHDKDYWGDPDTFRPERFINEHDGHFKKDEVLNPFSLGKRVCPGESLSKDELFLFLTGLLQQFNFEIDKNSPPTLEPRMALITRTHPYNVIIKTRNIIHAEH